MFDAAMEILLEDAFVDRTSGMRTIGLYDSGVTFALIALLTGIYFV
jgi:hypothetical protein